MDVLQPSEIREGYCALPYSSVSSPSTSRSASLSWLSFVLHIAKPVPVTNKDMFGFNSKALYYFFPSVPYRVVRDVQVQFFPVTRRQSGRIRVYVLRVICEFRFHMLFRTLLNCYNLVFDTGQGCVLRVSGSMFAFARLSRLSRPYTDVTTKITIVISSFIPLPPKTVLFFF